MTTLSQARPFFGKRVMWAAFVMAAFGWGLGFYGPSVYLQTLVAQGWPLGLVSAAVTAHFLAGALIVANLPALHRRFGIPAVTTAGAAVLALGVAGWALAHGPVQLFLAAALSGAGWVTLGAAAVNAVISPWFVRTRPAALAMAYNGASVGGIVFSPLLVALIAAVGFPATSALVGAVMLAVLSLIASRLYSVTPEAIGERPDGDAPSAPAPAASNPAAPAPAGFALWRDRRFASLSAGMALGLFAQVGLIAHLISVLVPLMGPRAASFAMALATAAAIVGRTAVGQLMPPSADRRLIACASYAVQILGTLVLLAGGGALGPALIGVALFGLGIGNATSLPPLIAQSEFAREDVPRVVALIVATGQGAYAFAPAAFGLARVIAETQVAGGGQAALFLGAALVKAAAIGCFLAGRR